MSLTLKHGRILILTKHALTVSSVVQIYLSSFISNNIISGLFMNINIYILYIYSASKHVSIIQEINYFDQ